MAPAGGESSGPHPFHLLHEAFPATFPIRCQRCGRGRITNGTLISFNPKFTPWENGTSSSFYSRQPRLSSGKDPVKQPQSSTPFTSHFTSKFGQTIFLWFSRSFLTFICFFPVPFLYSQVAYDIANLLLARRPPPRSKSISITTSAS